MDNEIFLILSVAACIFGAGLVVGGSMVKIEYIKKNNCLKQNGAIYCKE